MKDINHIINNYDITYVRKYFFVFYILVYFIVVADVSAQSHIIPIKLQLNDKNYLFVKFPSEISYADMGSFDFTAEKSIKNVLKMKAEVPNFEKTNLSVVTTDGRYYSFIVEYNAKPSFIAVDMTNVKDSLISKDIIPSTHIEVSNLHTTHIILPTKVADIAIGHKEVISEKAETIDNIVKVKSIVNERGKFYETSLTVVTVDGNIYPMTVGFAKNPREMSISFSEGGTALFCDSNVDTDNMKKMSEFIIEKGRFINDLGVEKDKMVFQLCSVFTDQDIIAFYLYTKNNSKIDYSIDFLRAYIADKKVDKYTITKDEDLYPLYSYYSNADGVVHGKEGMSIVLFFKKFTIPQKKILFFELYEENGGRNLLFKASNKTIINAKVIKNK